MILGVISIMISVVAIILAIIAYIKSSKRSNLFLVKDGKDYIIKDNNNQEIITITKL